MEASLRTSVRSTVLSTIREEETSQERSIAKFRAAKITKRHFGIEELISHINRDQAEVILKKNALGTFLLRPCSQAECIAISVNRGEIIHGLLKQVGDLFQMHGTRDELRQDQYSEDEIDDWLQPYPIAVFLEFYKMGATDLERGKFIKV